MPGTNATPSQTTTVSKTELPAWVDAAGQQNYQSAVDLANKPLEQYQGTRVAPLSATTTQAFDFFKDHLNAGSGATAAANTLYSRLGDPNSFAADVKGYMNPYIDNVESKSLSALNDSRIQSLMGNADSAIKAKAFGGSRGAIVDGVTNAETAKSAGLLSAQLRSAGFDSAVANRRADASAAGAGLLNTGDQEQNQMLKQFTGLSSIGAQETGQAQKVIDADMAKFDEAKQDPITKLNLKLAALGMVPYSQTTNASTTGTAEKPGFDWGSAGIGLASILAGAL